MPSGLILNILLLAGQPYHLLPKHLSEIVEGPGVGSWLLPSGHFVIYNLGSGEQVKIRRVVAQLLSVDLVGNGDLDRVEIVQDIELGEVQSRVVVDRSAVLDNHEVEPSASASSASRCSPFSANLLELVSNLFKIFRLESSLSDTGGVSLDHSDSLGDVLGVQGESGNDTAQCRVGGSHKWVRAIVDVEH
ncbi:hypothetical protein HG530_009090 [Fusarium avenaceum]|nr:hypothetical protein HG530_009090 [Fusarium avenaceum]